MKKIVFVIVTCLFFSAIYADAQQAPKPVKTKTDNIKHLLKISGTADYAYLVVEDVFKNYKQMMTMVPPEYWEKAMKEIDLNRFIDSVVVVYDKRFSNDEILNLISFFESPTGMKWAQQLGEMNEEVMQKASIYGNYIYTLLNEKLIKDKYIVQPEIEVIKKDQQKEESNPEPDPNAKTKSGKSTKKKK